MAKLCPFRLGSSGGSKDCVEDKCMAYLVGGDINVRCMMVTMGNMAVPMEMSVFSSNPVKAPASMSDLNTIGDKVFEVSQDVDKLRTITLNNDRDIEGRIKEDRRENKQLFDSIEDYIMKYGKEIEEIKALLGTTASKPKGKKVVEE